MQYSMANIVKNHDTLRNQQENLSSSIYMHTHAGSAFDDHGWLVGWLELNGAFNTD